MSDLQAVICADCRHQFELLAHRAASPGPAPRCPCCGKTDIWDLNEYRAQGGKEE